MALATADGDRAPDVRFVLLEICDARGLVFCCDADSRKVGEVKTTPRASVALYWHRAGLQARVEGTVVPAEEREVDRCWRRYSRDAQLVKWAAAECGQEVTRKNLIRAHRRVERRFAGRTVPRPESWIGFRIVPDAVELWRQHPRHLHERERFERGRRGWHRRTLAP